MKAYLLGRANRSEYWIFVICMTVVGVIANFIFKSPTLLSALTFIPWAVIASRRLRDFGWSPWWCVSTVAIGFIVGFVSGLINAAAMADAGHPMIGGAMVKVTYGLANWAFIIFIGSRKSLPAGTDRPAANVEAAAL